MKEKIMASGHLHSVKLDDKFHHLYNLQYMDSDEIMVIYNSLNGVPIPIEKQPSLDGLKKVISELILSTRNKDKEFKKVQKTTLVGGVDVSNDIDVSTKDD